MPERRAEEYVDVSTRLLHNAQVYFHVARRLSRMRVGFDPRPSWEVETALVESFAMHTRGLADFFFSFEIPKSRRKRDDAHAVHYFASPELWKEAVGEPGRWLRQVRERADKGVGRATTVDRFGEQVAHLRFAELPLSDYARGWPVMQLASEIGSAMKVFAESVDPTFVSPDFRRKALREIPVASRLRGEFRVMGVWSPPALRRVLP